MKNYKDSIRTMSILSMDEFKQVVEAAKVKLIEEIFTHLTRETGSGIVDLEGAHAQAKIYEQIANTLIIKAQYQKRTVYWQDGDMQEEYSFVFPQKVFKSVLGGDDFFMAWLKLDEYQYKYKGVTIYANSYYQKIEDDYYKSLGWEDRKPVRHLAGEEWESEE